MRKHPAEAAIVFGLLVWSSHAIAQEPGDIAAFLLGLRDQKVFSEGEAAIPLNGIWNVPSAMRVTAGRYKAAHKDGVLRLEAEGGSLSPCVYQAKFTIKTASQIDNTEVWTIDLTKAELGVERKETGFIRGIGLRVKGPKAFCYTSTMRADACTENQLFDDQTPNAGPADLDRKSQELQSIVNKLKTQGCGG